MMPLRLKGVNYMPTTRLPKLAFLLLVLLIGVAFTFGGQLFVAMANNSTNNPPNIKSCKLDKNAPTRKQIKIKLGQGVDASTLDITKFHLTCR
jgi:hypothetical protein